MKTQLIYLDDSYQKEMDAQILEVLPDGVGKYKIILDKGGHIVDFALYLLGYSPKQLSPLKADHGKKPFIVYQGVLQVDIKQKLQEKVDELIAKDLKFSWEFQSYEALKKEAIYLQPNLPTNKPLRTFRLETVGAVADGGTQLHATSEAGKVLVEAITIERETTIIHYSLPS